MAIGDKKVKPSKKKQSDSLTPSQKMFADASVKPSKVNLYVKDAVLLKEMKIAALEDDTSLSALFEEWGAAWLETRNTSKK